MRSCSATRSMSATSSVTPCSTWSRVLTSRNAESPLGVEQELRRRRIRRVPPLAPCATAMVVERRALIRGETGRGRLLDQLLVPALDRAVALPERDDGAVAVAEQLHLDVTCRAELALEIHAAIPEGRGRFARPRRQRGREIVDALDAAHPASAAAGRRLDQQREADAPRILDDARERSAARATGAGSSVPGTTGTPADRATRRAASLSPSAAIDGARRSDEDQPGVLDALARTTRAPRGSRSQDGSPARPCGARPRRSRRRGGSSPLPAPAPIRTATSAARTWSASRSASLVDGDRLDPQLMARPDDPQRDLAAIGDEDPREGRSACPCAKTARRPASVPDLRRSQRDVAVLLARVGVALPVEHLERSGSVAAGSRAERSRRRRIRATAAMYGLANCASYSATSRRAASATGSSASAIWSRKMMLTAPSAPITAISAVGHAKFMSPRMCLLLMTS